MAEQIEAQNVVADIQQGSLAFPPMKRPSEAMQQDDRGRGRRPILAYLENIPTPERYELAAVGTSGLRFGAHHECVDGEEHREHNDDHRGGHRQHLHSRALFRHSQTLTGEGRFS